MPEFKDLTGKRIGRLTVIKRDEDRVTSSGYRFTRWLCKCDCGTQKSVFANALNSGRTKSCGCMQKEIAKNVAGTIFKTHGETKTRLYGIWAGMKKRCYNENAYNYSGYGARGIRICDEWQSYEAFKKWSMENGYSDNLSIDRINVNGDYTPDNCRWADYCTQANNRRSTAYYTYNGEKYTISQLSEKYGVPHKKLYKRLYNGWSVERAINTK